MAERTYKCPICGEKNTKENSVTHSKRQYCFECYKSLEQNKKEREFLLKYICLLYKLNPNQKMDGRILKDLKDLNEEGHSYADVYKTLKYCAEIKKLTFDVKYALGCVRYYKNECMDYIQNLTNKTKQSEDLKPLQTIVVKTTLTAHNPRLNRKLINIENL